MGIKDSIKGWFEETRKGGLPREGEGSVSDGKLDAKDLKEIEEVRQELGVTDARDDRSITDANEAVQAAKRDGDISATDQHELDKIQKFLALRNDQVEKTRWDLARLRTLTDIRNGNLPTVPPNNASLRGVQLEPDETAHYSLSVELGDLPVTRGSDGVLMERASPTSSIRWRPMRCTRRPAAAGRSEPRHHEQAPGDPHGQRQDGRDQVRPVEDLSLCGRRAPGENGRQHGHALQVAIRGDRGDRRGAAHRVDEVARPLSAAYREWPAPAAVVVVAAVPGLAAAPGRCCRRRAARSTRRS